MNKHHYHHRCSRQKTSSNIVPHTFIINYLHPLSKQEKQCFLNQIQGVIIDNIGPTLDLIEINNDDWRHLKPSAIGDLIESMSGHRMIVYPDRFLTIDDPPSVSIDSPSSTSNSVFDVCNIHENAFPAEPPDDPMYKVQWYLTHTNVNFVWQDYALLGSGITVAVLDTGADGYQKDLQTTFLPGYNLVNDSDNTWDSNGHGTKISGIIAAHTNNEFGMASVAPHAKVRPIKTLNEDEDTTASFLKGLIYVAEQVQINKNYAQIINCSIGSIVSSEQDIPKLIKTTTSIIKDLESLDVLVVFGAGNSGDEGNPLIFPALLADLKYSLSNIITVGGIDEDNKPVPSSTHGSNYVQVAAPGIDIWTTDTSPYVTQNDNFAFVSGTSYAAPIVCGILALMYQLIKDIPMKTGTKAKYLRNKLFESAIQTPETGPQSDKYWRYGVVDAYAAIQAMYNDPPKPII